MLFREGGYQDICFRLVRFDICITTLNGDVKQTVGHTQLKIDKQQKKFFLMGKKRRGSRTVVELGERSRLEI